MGTHAVRTLSANNAAKDTLNTPPSKLDNIIQVRVEIGAVVVAKFNMKFSNIALNWSKLTKTKRAL